MNGGRPSNHMPPTCKDCTLQYIVLCSYRNVLVKFFSTKLIKISKTFPVEPLPYCSASFNLKTFGFMSLHLGSFEVGQKKNRMVHNLSIKHRNRCTVFLPTTMRTTVMFLMDMTENLLNALPGVPTSLSFSMLNILWIQLHC